MLNKLFYLMTPIKPLKMLVKFKFTSRINLTLVQQYLKSMEKKIYAKINACMCT